MLSCPLDGFYSLVSFVVAGKLSDREHVSILIVMFYFSVIFAIAYIAFNIYLVIHMCCSIGSTRLTQYTFVQKYVLKNSGTLLENSDNQNSYSR